MIVGLECFAKELLSSVHDLKPPFEAAERKKNGTMKSNGLGSFIVVGFISVHEVKSTFITSNRGK